MIKVLHVLYQSTPNVSGSSTRSKGIVDSMYKSDVFSPVVITSPVQASQNQKNEEINGVRYYRTCNNFTDKFTINQKKSFFSQVLKFLSFILFAFEILVVAKKEKVTVIHAHAMFLCGYPAYLVSRILGCKFVYEIRSDWHLDNNFSYSKKLQYLCGFLEKDIAKKSDSLVVISSELHKKYSKFNDNCYLVSNAINNELLCNEKQKVKKSNPVFGFIGSVIPLEGIPLVVEAFNLLKKQYSITPTFILVGGGSDLDYVKELVNKYKLTSQFKIFGKVPITEVSSYYDMIDVIINFRIDEEIAHTVTPLKPLEAMGRKKLILASDVKGMKELVKHMETGLLIDCENVTLLSQIIYKVSLEFSNYNDIIINGYNFVLSEKLWSKQSLKYLDIYKK